MTKCSEDLSPSSTIVTTQITPQLSAFVHRQEKEHHYKKAISGNRWKRSRVVSDKDKMDVWGLFVWQHLPLSPTVIPAFTRAQHRKKSSSCLIHLLLDTHKIQLKPNNNAPPIPRPPSAAIQVSCWGSGLVDFLNPPLPAWGLGKKREQNQ